MVIQVRIDPDAHVMAKVLAAQQNRTVGSVYAEAIRVLARKQGTPADTEVPKAADEGRRATA